MKTFLALTTGLTTGFILGTLTATYIFAYDEVCENKKKELESQEDIHGGLDLGL